MKNSGMWPRVVWQTYTEVSDDPPASIIAVYGWKISLDYLHLLIFFRKIYAILASQIGSDEDSRLLEFEAV